VNRGVGFREVGETIAPNILTDDDHEPVLSILVAFALLSLRRDVELGEGVLAVTERLCGTETAVHGSLDDLHHHVPCLR